MTANLVLRVPDEPGTLIRNARQLITLQGKAGPRHGPAMSELTLIPNGALLIRNDLIEEVGPARRVENLAAAKNAREIDASGRVVMPAFIDADTALIVPPPSGRHGAQRDEDGSAIRVISRKNLEIRAAAVAAERARYGCVAVASATQCATDLKNVIKVLRAHRALQLKPLRIRSIFSYHGTPVEELRSRWLPAIRKNKLASVIDLAAPSGEDPLELAALRDAAVAASNAGFALRLRSPRQTGSAALMLALTGGAISIVSPLDALHAYTSSLAAIGCVRVIPASEAFDNPENAAANIRAAIAGGASLALASSYRTANPSSFQMQFLLHLAVQYLGMTAEEAIVATTYNAACALRLSHVTGSLQPEKQADLVMMEVSDYRELARRAGHYDISLVMRAGRIVYRRLPPGHD